MKTELNVQGLHCKSCEILIQDIAEDFPEITSCTVDVKKGKIVVEHEKNSDLDSFKKEIEAAGEYKFV